MGLPSQPTKIMKDQIIKLANNYFGGTLSGKKPSIVSESDALKMTPDSANQHKLLLESWGYSPEIETVSKQQYWAITAQSSISMATLVMGHGKTPAEAWEDCGYTEKQKRNWCLQEVDQLHHDSRGQCGEFIW